MSSRANALFAHLDGFEMTKSQHDWLEQRFENMTAKEELLFRGAMQIEGPKTAQETLQILHSLDHYQLLYGADDDISLGRFVMQHIHPPTPAARGYLDPEIVGATYRNRGVGIFVEDHYSLYLRDEPARVSLVCQSSGNWIICFLRSFNFLHHTDSFLSTFVLPFGIVCL